MQRLYLADADGACHVVFTEPLCMKDKAAWSHYAAQADLWAGARLAGHQHIVITHCCWVRADFSACRRLQRRRFAALALHLESELGESQAHLMDRMSWLACVGRFAHDSHNSLRWSVSHLSVRETMQDCWVVMQSLRNGFGQLLVALRHWLVQNVAYEDGDQELLTDLWRFRGMGEEWVSFLASDLQVRWEGGRLVVKKALIGRDDLPQMVTVAPLHIWKLVGQPVVRHRPGLQMFGRITFPWPRPDRRIGAVQQEPQPLLFGRLLPRRPWLLPKLDCDIALARDRAVGAKDGLLGALAPLCGC